MAQSKRDGRDFKLSDEQHKELIQRQKGRCAFTGEKLNEGYVVHHVVPAGQGGARNAKVDAFVRDHRRNAVLVNDEASYGSGRGTGAHLHVHGGRFHGGACAEHSAFKYSHGGDKKAHARWAKDGETFASREVWKDQQRQQAAARKTREPAKAKSAEQERARVVTARERAGKKAPARKASERTEPTRGKAMPAKKQIPAAKKAAPASQPARKPAPAKAPAKPRSSDSRATSSRAGSSKPTRPPAARARGGRSR